MRRYIAVLLVCLMLMSTLPPMLLSALANAGTVPQKPKYLPNVNTPYTDIPFINTTVAGGASDWEGTVYTPDAAVDFSTSEGILLTVECRGERIAKLYREKDE